MSRIKPYISDVHKNSDLPVGKKAIYTQNYHAIRNSNEIICKPSTRAPNTSNLQTAV